MKQGTFLLLILLLLTSCAPGGGATQDVVGTLPPDTAVTSPPEGTMSPDEPIDDPFAPKPGDVDLTRGTAFVQESGLLIRESYPPQISLNVAGELPTPCHQLRIEIGKPTSDNKINVDVYSVVNPDRICTQVLEPFEASVNLGTFPSGHYAVYVNGELAGEFDS